jgi:hypothetical protein
LATAFTPDNSSAAPPTGEQIYYTNQRVFLIPFTPGPDSANLSQVLLYVSEDLGKGYKLFSTNSPTDPKFRFTAPGDGWYWFAVQTKDTAGRFSPPNVNAVAPGLKVCVDTLPPAIYVKQVGTSDAIAAFEWNIREDNPDLFTLRADYRAMGTQDWSPLQIPPRLVGQFPWNPATKGPWEVRVQMRDKAGNQGEQTTTVTAGAWRPDTPGTGTGTPPPNPGRGNVIMVNSRSIQLDYQVNLEGKSGTTHAEIYITENDGRTWAPHVNKAPRKGPHTVQVKGEGVYGFYIAPVSGVGLSDPPVMGTLPQVSVEVDTTPPSVKLVGAPLVGTGTELNRVTIKYLATDKNLAARPIRILWTEDASLPNAEWKPVESTTLPNEGVYTWTVPESVPAQFYVKVEATDTAGNVGTTQMPPLVKVDPIKPRAEITGVKVGNPVTASPPSPP